MGVYTTINDGTAHCQSITYSGNGVNPTTKTYGGNSNMQPDLCVGRKLSSAGDSWYWVDSTRGATRRIMSDNTNAEDGFGLNAFATDGFTCSGLNNQNQSGQTYINYGWKANGGTTSTNSSGTITSTVQANTTAGFSIISYTGNGTDGATIGHGLNATPEIFFPKCTSTSTNWEMYYFPPGGTRQYSYLNLTNQFNTWSHNAPSSTIISLSGSGDSNGNGRTNIGYAFHSVQGFSKIGTYTGNGSVDGPFVYTGFKPAWFMTKRVDAASYWTLWDNKRSSSGGGNELDYYLELNANNEQSTGNSVNDVDFLANGVKIREDNGDINADGSPILFMAFAENPFVSSAGVPTTAR
tara:strand:- start:24 stop:1079 length:1056 start_codon:yes stop_codon:yes gene_type:complete